MKIALFAAPEGHLSMAQSVERHLKKQHQVEMFLERNIFLNLYTLLYQFFPPAHQIPYRLSKNKFSKKALSDYFMTHYQQKLEAFYQEHKPDICISTYVMYAPTLEHFQNIGRTPFVNVISDPRSIHPLLISETATTNLVFDQQALEICQEMSPGSAYQVSGWLVRPDFKPVASRTAIRKKLQLKPDLFTILITAGSEGTMMITKLAPALLRLNQPTQIIVVAGNNLNLYRSMRAFGSVLDRVNPNSQLVPLQFVENMHQYMQAADLVVGKAGPNTLFESVATHTPFMAVTHIPGQEDGNLDIIREHKLGFVEENPLKAMWKLKDIIENPAQLEMFTEPLKKMADHNAQAPAVLDSVISKLSQ